MKYADRDLLDRLAAQYVLGTLRGRARQRFERLCASNEHAMNAVKSWEDRFVPLLAGIRSEPPSARVWQAIERRLGFAGQRSSPGALEKLFGWFGTRVAATAFAALAVVAIGIGVVIQQAQRLDTVAVIAQDVRELWRVQVTRDAEMLVVTATDGVAIDADHSYELWALPASGTPVSLGLLSSRGAVKLALTDAQRLALHSATNIAVSLEPVGGSPTGAPTGPVLHVTAVRG